jgi:hypothetical protein
MGIIKNEQDVKQDSLFLKYEVGDSGNELMLISHLYKIDRHFLPTQKKSVLCLGDKCQFCSEGLKKSSEFNYMVLLNGGIGVMDIKASVFYNIQGISKAQKKDPRAISWTVIKTGEGLGTEYTTSKNDNLTSDQFEKVNDDLEANTDKLSKLMIEHEKQLKTNYNELVDVMKDEVDPNDVPDFN